jgi:hypothetical protein
MPPRRSPLRLGAFRSELTGDVSSENSSDGGILVFGQGALFKIPEIYLFSAEAELQRSGSFWDALPMLHEAIARCLSSPRMIVQTARVPFLA